MAFSINVYLFLLFSSWLRAACVSVSVCISICMDFEVSKYQREKCSVAVNDKSILCFHFQFLSQHKILIRCAASGSQEIVKWFKMMSLCYALCSSIWIYVLDSEESSKSDCNRQIFKSTFNSLYRFTRNRIEANRIFELSHSGFCLIFACMRPFSSIQRNG